jgi:tripartite-type tricarboxylate transporter receptor subunit TctC
MQSGQPGLLTTAKRILSCAASALAAICLVSAVGQAQTFPEKAISLIVPFAPGGAADTTGRLMAEAMAKHLGQAVIVENAGGAGGTIGVAKVKQAAPTGYTIGLGHMGTHAASVGTYAKLPYDPRTDFDYLGLVATTPNIIFVRKDFPGETLADFIAYAREKKSDLKMGHSGIGAASHITCVLLFQLIGVEPTYVPYRGFGQTIQDLAGGRLDGSCDLVASVTPHVKAGTVKALVVATPERSPVLPNVPTAAEAGFPAFAAETWTGLYAPKGLPEAALARLREAVAKGLADAVYIEKLRLVGATVPKADALGGPAMLKLVISEVPRWVDILKKANVELQ